jgi:hypothetical protein
MGLSLVTRFASANAAAGPVEWQCDPVLHWSEIRASIGFRNQGSVGLQTGGVKQPFLAELEQFEGRSKSRKKATRRPAIYRFSGGGDGIESPTPAFQSRDPKRGSSRGESAVNSHMEFADKGAIQIALSCATLLRSGHVGRVYGP